jgi:D-3-phosphoglycerate dehydrogenase
MQLAENLGELVKQLTKGNLKNISITVNGNLSELNVAPLEVAVQKGIFSSTVEGVNFVNAPLIAKKRGINIVTSKSAKDCTFIGSISVTLTSDIDENTVTGALIAKDMPRIVRINDYNMSIEAEEHMLMIPHENKPAMVAKVAAVIGESNININRMQVAQKSNKKDNVSIMIITIDKDVNDLTMNTINQIDGIQNAQYIKLNS